MNTAYYDLIKNKNGLPVNDIFGSVFDPNCIQNLKKNIDNTGTDIDRYGITIAHLNHYSQIFIFACNRSHPLKKVPPFPITLPFLFIS